MVTRDDDRDLVALQRRVDRYERFIGIGFALVAIGLVATGILFTLAMFAEGT